MEDGTCEHECDAEICRDHVDVFAFVGRHAKHALHFLEPVGVGCLAGICELRHLDQPPEVSAAELDDAGSCVSVKQLAPES